MVDSPPFHAYVIAIGLGIPVFSIPDFQPLLFALYFLFAGALLGYLWPQKSWRWGLWLIAPMFGVLGLSVLFAGGQGSIIKDIPIMLLVIASPCLGSFLLSRYKLKSRKN
jgi:hypothetical protein